MVQKHLQLILCRVVLIIAIHFCMVSLYWELYWEHSAAVRTIDGMTSQIKKGERQGCILSPNLFKIYTENIFREVEDMKGEKIGGVNINNIRYADDTLLLAKVLCR